MRQGVGEVGRMRWESGQRVDASSRSLSKSDDGRETVDAARLRAPTGQIGECARQTTLRRGFETRLAAPRPARCGSGSTVRRTRVASTRHQRDRHQREARVAEQRQTRPAAHRRGRPSRDCSRSARPWIMVRCVEVGRFGDERRAGDRRRAPAEADQDEPDGDHGLRLGADRRHQQRREQQHLPDARS